MPTNRCVGSLEGDDEDLYVDCESNELYDGVYKKTYVDEWPVWLKQRRTEHDWITCMVYRTTRVNWYFATYRESSKYIKYTNGTPWLLMTNPTPQYPGTKLFVPLNNGSVDEVPVQLIALAGTGPALQSPYHFLANGAIHVYKLPDFISARLLLSEGCTQYVMDNANTTNKLRKICENPILQKNKRCACFLPENVYLQKRDDLAASEGISWKLLNLDPVCISQECQTSVLKPAGSPVCPDLIACRAELNNRGTISADEIYINCFATAKQPTNQPPTNQPPTNQPPTNQPATKPNVGTIVGIIVGILVGAIVLCGVLVFVRRRYRA